MNKTAICHAQNQISSADQVAAVFYQAGHVIQKRIVQASHFITLLILYQTVKYHQSNLFLFL